MKFSLVKLLFTKGDLVINLICDVLPVKKWTLVVAINPNITLQVDQRKQNIFFVFFSFQVYIQRRIGTIYSYLWKHLLQMLFIIFSLVCSISRIIDRYIFKTTISIFCQLLYLKIFEFLFFFSIFILK